MGTLTVVKLTLLVIFLQDVDSCPEVREGRIIKTKTSSMFTFEADWFLVVTEGGDSARKETDAESRSQGDLGMQAIRNSR